jgi:hypothetical protein
VRQALGIGSELSRQSTLLIGIFTVVFAAAVLTDVAALLQYIGVVSGLPVRILEIGSSATAATIVPLVVMGMSISSDLNRKA